MNEEKLSAKKPVVFFGSTGEAKVLAKKLVEGLSKSFDVRPWFGPDVFDLSSFTLESLERQLEESDAGVFLFTHEDATRRNGTGPEMPAVRDNLILEYGMWVGRYGRQRAIVVAHDTIHDAISDVAGMTIAMLSDDERPLDQTIASVTSQLHKALTPTFPGSTLRGQNLLAQSKVKVSSRNDCVIAANVPTGKSIVVEIENLADPAGREFVPWGFPVNAHDGIDRIDSGKGGRIQRLANTSYKHVSCLICFGDGPDHVGEARLRVFDRETNVQIKETFVRWGPDH